MIYIGNHLSEHDQVIGELGDKLFLLTFQLAFMGIEKLFIIPSFAENMVMHIEEI